MYNMYYNEFSVPVSAFLLDNLSNRVQVFSQSCYILKIELLSYLNQVLELCRSSKCI